jgi:hypothetical protein
MKTRINRTAAALLAGAALAACLLGAQASSPSGSVNYDWKFNSNVNPAPPDTSSATNVAQAAVAPGGASDGWLQNDPVFGSAQGIWDLGQFGTITLTSAGGFVAPSSQTCVVTVKVIQYQGGPYEDYVEVSVPGATLLSVKATTVASAKIGVWVADEFQWSVPAGTSVDSILVTAPETRSLVDEVVVAVSAATPAPPVLTIQPVATSNGQMQVSWPSTYANMVLESSSDLNNPAGWTAVQTPVQTANGTSSVNVDMTGVARFYRLRQP